MSLSLELSLSLLQSETLLLFVLHLLEVQLRCAGVTWDSRGSERRAGTT